MLKIGSVIINCKQRNNSIIMNNKWNEFYILMHYCLQHKHITIKEKQEWAMKKININE